MNQREWSHLLHDDAPAEALAPSSVAPYAWQPPSQGDAPPPPEVPGPANLRTHLVSAAATVEPVPTTPPAEDAPWWRAYSDLPPQVYDSVRAPLHEEYARAAKAYSLRDRPHGLGVPSVVEIHTTAAVLGWATLGYLPYETIDALRWLLGANIGGRSRALVLAALEIAKPQCDERLALSLLREATALPREDPEAITRGVLAEIQAERERQDARWGVQDHPSVASELIEREGGVKPGRLCKEYGVPSPHMARAACEGEASAGEATFAGILVEEVAEAIGAAAESEARVREELVQVAAVAVAWIEAIDRRAAKEGR